MTILRLLLLALAPLGAFDVSEDLLAAARKGDAAQVKALLDAGADVNAKSPYGSTALFFACDRGHVEVIKLLIDKGADVNVEDTFYHATALYWAVTKNRPEIVKLLLDHGAKSAAMAVTSGTQSGYPKIVKVGLDKGGVDKAALSNALAIATRTKNTEIIDMLKAAGATPPEPVKTVELDPSVLAGYVGTYQGGRGGTEMEMSIVVKGQNLSGAITGQPALTYAPSDKTHFHSVEMQGVTLEFTGEGFTLSQGGMTLPFKKKAQPK